MSSLPELITKTAGKNSFFEAFDALDIGRAAFIITLYDPSKEEGSKVGNRVAFYLSIEDIRALAAAIAGGTIDTFLAVTNQFPAMAYSIPRKGKKMRQWLMSRSQRGLFQIKITEKELAETWNDEDAKELGQATFFINPFKFLSMLLTIDAYANKWVPNIKESEEF